MEAVLPTYAYAALVLEWIALSVYFIAHDLHPPPSVSLPIGWVGAGSMVLMHVYSLRRRVRALSRWGRIGRWLQLHIFLGLQGALLVTFHSIQLSTLANISGATFALTLVVVVSGTFGRYLFSMLPRGVAGERLSVREIEAELTALRPAIDSAVAASTSSPALSAVLAEILRPVPAGAAPLSLAELAADDRRTRAGLRSLDQALGAAGHSIDAGVFARLRALARRRLALQRRLATLSSAERLFRRWTLLHRPLSFVLFGLIALHVLGHYVYAAAFSS
jgi:hypothetical protein